MKPIVSAIITTHNRLELLPRAIESVLAQTYRDIECIVVSDNSDDGTNEYCSARNDIVFINIPKEESKGGNHARNVGILKACGKYVAFLDDDDYWLPDKIEKQLALAESILGDIIYCWRTDECVSTDDRTVFVPGPIKNDSTGDLSRKVLLTSCVTTSSCIFVKRQLLLSIGLFDENLRFWQDYELTIRLAQRAPFFCVTEPLVVYRVNPSDNNRLTNKYYEWWEAVRYIHKKHKKLYSSLTFKEKRAVKVLTYKDAMMRAYVSGLDKEVKRLEHKFKLWQVPEIIKDKLSRKSD